MVKSALDVYIGAAPPNSPWHDERTVRDKFRIHYADLDPAVGSTRLFVVARNPRVGFAKTLGAHDCRGNSGLHQEVADSFGTSNMQYQLDRSPGSNPIVSLCSEKFLICFAAAVLTFFIAGLLYLLCFEHVDNLGAYSMPSETGLLIPSVSIRLSRAT